MGNKPTSMMSHLPALKVMRGVIDAILPGWCGIRAMRVEASFELCAARCRSSEDERLDGGEGS